MSTTQPVVRTAQVCTGGMVYRCKGFGASFWERLFGSVSLGTSLWERLVWETYNSFRASIDRDSNGRLQALASSRSWTFSDAGKL